MKQESSMSKVLPVLFGFFIMGFVDVVGIATNYVKSDFDLTDSVANLLPMMVFMWFFVFSIPTGLLMNKIGRKKTVVLSMVITFIAMLIPFLLDVFATSKDIQFKVMLVAFALLGIGNTILQVSLNPLLTNVVKGDRLTSSLTWGQFIKALASILGPIIATFAASRLGNWKLIFPIFAIVTLLSSSWLYFTSIHEEPFIGKTSSFLNCFKLLGDKTILLLFLGILLVVGVDVGLNTTIPKFLSERCGIPLKEAGLDISIYFIARAIGAFVGAILLIKLSARKFFIVSMFVAIAAMALALMLSNLWALLAMIFLLGFAVANVFSIIFSAALQKKPERANEISGLMIMGVSGGALFPWLMGVVSDHYNSQRAAFAVLLGLLCYLLFLAFSLKKA
jgi:FHS family L-fucose permease-like MFS transporter